MNPSTVADLIDKLLDAPDQEAKRIVRDEIIRLFQTRSFDPVFPLALLEELIGKVENNALASAKFIEFGLWLFSPPKLPLGDWYAVVTPVVVCGYGSTITQISSVGVRQKGPDLLRPCLPKLLDPNVTPKVTPEID